MWQKQVSQVLALQIDGRSVGYIANALGFPRCTVTDTLQRFLQTGTYTRRPEQGKRRAINRIQDRFLRMQELRDRKVIASALV